MYNMTREQALEEIKKLTEYVSNLPKNNHPKCYARGQLYKSRGDGIFMLVPTTKNATLPCMLVCLTPDAGCCLASGLENAIPDDFVYLGDAEDLLSVADITRRKTDLLQDQIKESLIKILSEAHDYILTDHDDSGLNSYNGAYLERVDAALQSLKTAAG